jgi:glutathionyl-hydroquinone reductase
MFYQLLYVIVMMSMLMMSMMMICMQVNRPSIHLCAYYDRSHSTLNAYAVIPKGPDVVSSLLLPHNRDQLFPHKK